MEKKIVIATIILFFVSSAFLLYTGEKDKDPNYQKNWWIVYFSDPKSDELDFVIENHSDANKFDWRVIKNRQTWNEGSVIVEKGESTSIDIDEQDEKGKIIIEVESANTKKQIYRNY